MTFDTVVCAAAPGSMVEANRAPQNDTARIDQIMGHLSRIKAKKLVLISTIATLKDFGHGQDEGTTAYEEDLAYGRNRRRLEAFCAENFDRHLILRLPALFGHGLRKNMLFDLMNPLPSMLTHQRRDALAAALEPATAARLMSFYRFDDVTTMWHLDRNAVDASDDRQQLGAAVKAAGFEALRFTNPASQFQFFDLSQLSDVIDNAMDAGLSLLHLAPEPLQAQTVVAALRGEQMPESTARIHREDMQTRHASLFGQSGRYTASAEQVLAGLKQFLAAGG
ncbi:hypothetical protein [Paracoccus laeviglucosivorans]|uniref:hypothetical protein n=1 Tax=Paracoccus laeviglucosivorans TaxID=1197861 RepID=UPI001FE52500|nr:hypothetical protein [Paracoccus laeviglucosivorans]